MQETITAVICAYNEQKTIEAIIKDIQTIPLFDECIVVNDGSTDNTGELIKKMKAKSKIKDIHLENNKGKGFAMATACEHSQSDILVFIDADLINFTYEHAYLLINPLINESVDLVIGQANETIIRQEINPFKKLSGQRAMRRIDLLPLLQKMKTSGYGVETLINMLFKSHSKTVKYVILDKLIHKVKFEKSKPHVALKEFFVEGFEIFHTLLTNMDMQQKAVKQTNT